MLDVAEVFSARPVGPSQFQARCTAHDDSDPSLSIRLAEDRALVHCFAGCEPAEILAAVGLTLPDLLFPRRCRQCSAEFQPKHPDHSTCSGCFGKGVQKPKVAQLSNFDSSKCTRNPQVTQVEKSSTSTGTHHNTPRARTIWESAERDDAAVSDHPYCVSKGLTHAYGAGRATVTTKMLGEADCIVVPVRDLESEAVLAVQLIAPDGTKQSLGPIKGNALPLGNTLDPKLPRYIVEGWASAAWLLNHCEGRIGVFVAFGGGNMTAVAEGVSELYCGDVRIARECDERTDSES